MDGGAECCLYTFQNSAAIAVVVCDETPWCLSFVVVSAEQLPLAKSRPRCVYKWHLFAGRILVDEIWKFVLVDQSSFFGPTVAMSTVD
jgi:hypothetical protein